MQLKKNLFLKMNLPRHWDIREYPQSLPPRLTECLRKSLLLRSWTGTGSSSDLRTWIMVMGNKIFQGELADILAYKEDKLSSVKQYKLLLYRGYYSYFIAAQ